MKERHAVRSSIASVAWQQWRVAVGVLAGVLIGALAMMLATKATAWQPLAGRAGARGTATPQTLSEVLASGGEELAALDIARVNLLCAQGLRGAEALDVAQTLAALDTWATRVREETARHFSKFRQRPEDYQHSEAYFRALALVTVLQQDCGVRYNLERVRAPDFADARDLFLHGLTTGHGGTCVSLPVLYVAVGRRLGYPLKLVTAKGHLFARWESADGRERLNLEVSGQGLNTFPDEYYHQWPVALTAQEIASGQYLKSLTPVEELAVFLSARGHCLEAAGRLAEAQAAHAQAHVLAPRNPVYLGFLAAAVRKELPGWERVAVDLGQTEPKAKARAQ